MKTTLFLRNLLFILLLCFFSCCLQEEPSENPQEDIIGKWESADQSLVLEFTTDKKLTSIIKSEGGLHIETKGDAMFVDDKHILSLWKVNTGYRTNMSR